MFVTEAERDAILFDIRILEFHRAMETHRCRGEWAYYLTELMVMWQDGHYDGEHAYILS